MRRVFGVPVLTAALLLALTACSNPFSKAEPQLPKAEAVLSGKIAQLRDDSFLLAGTGASDLYIVSSEPDLYNPDNTPADASALQSGQTVEIGYSGGIMESYPAQIGNIVYIKITGQEDDLAGFYQMILSDLWNTDEGLNSDISILAFDLSQVTNLSESEKSALVYMVSSEHNLQGITGTFDELSEQGYINKEQLYFDNGMLFELTLSDVTGESFTFDASKWRSGTGAYYYNNCRAVKDGGAWSYTVGSEAIS
ncbi:hypothetical protein [Papillibacter cinnamivorans]|uniref:Lipoprotein n=1 Tax=Papillibacter cinnamivorans DSM 12816 TaxID=1122930 RepID=A0A1W1YX98_9FIRM|nr:hypothetical protein [Papillibacter cinnamivorans]SMC40774.1 hypothetical protein SAMN02745168_0746 [Papillibacter cinnamivorans DSM 12816]